MRRTHDPLMPDANEQLIVSLIQMAQQSGIPEVHVPLEPLMRVLQTLGDLRRETAWNRRLLLLQTNASKNEKK